MELTVITEFDSVEDAIAADESPAYQEALSPLPTARSRGFASLRPVLKRSKPGRARHPQHRWDRRRACAPTARQGCECSYARPRSKQAGGRPGGRVRGDCRRPIGRGWDRFWSSRLRRSLHRGRSSPVRFALAATLMRVWEVRYGERRSLERSDFSGTLFSRRGISEADGARS